MILTAFGSIIAGADPEAGHYYSDADPNYTVWTEVGDNNLTADDEVAEEALRFQVDRFTKIEDDPIVGEIKDALKAAGITPKYLVDYEKETGYIHHIWECEVD